MGNPDAPVKLVEYGSLGCHVCAEFEEQGAPELRDTYVKSGQVSWEFRTYLLFPTDPGVSMLLQCHSENAFFPLVEQLYAQQTELDGAGSRRSRPTSSRRSRPWRRARRRR